MEWVSELVSEWASKPATESMFACSLNDPLTPLIDSLFQWLTDALAHCLTTDWLTS